MRSLDRLIGDHPYSLMIQAELIELSMLSIILNKRTKEFETATEGNLRRFGGGHEEWI